MLSLERPVAEFFLVVVERHLARRVVAGLAATAQRAVVRVIFFVAVEAGDALAPVVGKVAPRMAALAQYFLMISDQRPIGFRIVVEQPRFPFAAAVAVHAVITQCAFMQFIGMTFGPAL